jgi:CheY-like chemotaxis protein
MHGEPLKILLVEDNYDHAELVMRCFEEHRIANKFFHVDDGEKALNFLFNKEEYADKDTYPKPNIILLDLRLPKVDGIEVLSRIKEVDSLKTIPIVVLTSSSNKIDISKAYENYANSYLVKPLDFDKFTEMMNDLGFYWLGWNSLPY